MPARGIHHIGIAVRDLDEAVATYEQLLGAVVEARETLFAQGADAVALRVGDGRVELLAALDDDTPIGRFLARRGPGMHHLAVEVEDLPAELARLEADGVHLIDREPEPGLYGLQVSFVHPDAAHGVLVELVTRG